MYMYVVCNTTYIARSQLFAFGSFSQQLLSDSSKCIQLGPALFKRIQLVLQLSSFLLQMLKLLHTRCYQ